MPVPAAGIVRAAPALSMFDPVHVGIDEFGAVVHTRIIYKNLLAAGEPGSGKSGLMNTLTAHAVLSALSRLVLFDGKQVELGMWDDIADEFVGPDLDKAIITLLRLQRVMDNRYLWLKAHGRREIGPRDNITVITSVFDEIALYSTVLGTEAQQKQFITLFRDLVARGRAAAMPVIAATQRPASTSSRKACATCSATAPPSAAPPPAAATSSSATAGRTPDSTPPPSARPSKASPTSSPKAAPRNWSRPPTCPTPTSPRWPARRLDPRHQPGPHPACRPGSHP